MSSVLLGIQRIITSEYPSDREVVRTMKEGEGPTTPLHRQHVRQASFGDAISQIVKAILDLVLWPVMSLFLLGQAAYGVYVDKKKGWASLGCAAIGVSIAPPWSALIHAQIAAYDIAILLGQASPESVAKLRQNAYEGFVLNNQSPTRYIYTTFFKK